MNYYNEIDPYAAQWLRNLIDAGHIAPGIVDERSITDVKPTDLAGYTQCHFFAGIGVWSYALRQSGWPDSRPVWTGSCPCQPFSTAGNQKGTADERHLWPVWFNLIRECRPSVVFGEQVEAAVKHGWLDLVQADLERENYACGAVGIPAAGVGAPHIRQRLYFVADATSDRWRRQGAGGAAEEGWQPRPERIRQLPDGFEGHGAFVGMANDINTRPQGRVSGGTYERRENQHGHVGRDGAANFWADCDWLFCQDGKWRPVEPGTFPLAHGAPARVGRLRAYGNAINAVQAQIFIEAGMSCMP